LTGGPITTTGTVTLGGTLDLSSPPAIGGTAAAAGTFTTLIGGNDVANYGQLTGGATTKAVEFKSLGSDTNVAYAIRSKGTGAIDLAAGSSGVNISNGGTVTAITRTASGSGYTSFPTWSASAPTTAGGTTASGTINSLLAFGATVVSGGTGYTLNDTITLVGGTPTATAATYTVSAVSSGVITAVTALNFGAYSALPTNPVSVTGGTGAGATLTVTYGVSANSFVIGAAGSGYVEQPTVTFSGGGGSGAAAYATVGSQTIIKGLGTSTGTVTNQSIMFQTPAGNALLIRDAGNTVDAHVLIQGTGNGYGFISGEGSNANASLYVGAKASGSVRFSTNGTSLTEQMRVSHTASAVNYVQVTGAATGGAPEISAQGSDASISIQYTAKNAGNHLFRQAGGINFRVAYGVTAPVNNLAVTGSLAGTAPSLYSQGTDTDIQLSLVPKGLGIILMNQQTPTAVTATGTLTIANLLTQIITSTSATAVSLTLPTGTLSDAGVSGGTSAVNTSFDWSIINTGSASGDVTLVAGTAHTIVGSATVTVGTSGKFRSRKTATNTFVSYRV
jgi:hypothetical protein